MALKRLHRSGIYSLRVALLFVVLGSCKIRAALVPQFRTSSDSHAFHLKDLILPTYLSKLIYSYPDQVIPNATFLERLLHGVESDGCKGHLYEWYLRAVGDVDITTQAEQWVLQMGDAWGKLPEGILSGHVNSFGDFYECVEIHVEGLNVLNKVYPTPTTLNGRYCMVYMSDYATAMNGVAKPIEANRTRYNFRRHENESLAKRGGAGLNRAVSAQELLSIIFQQSGRMINMIPSIGVCKPSSCSQADIQQILVNGVDMLYDTTGSLLPEMGESPEELIWPYTVSCRDNDKPSLTPADISVITLLVILGSLALGAGTLDYISRNESEQKCHKALTYFRAFSLYTNTKKWMSTRRSADDFGCLHGIRFLSMAWVVLAHTYIAAINIPMWNQVDIRRSYDDWTILAVINGFFAVDTFFVLSALLVTYNILKMLDKTSGKMNVSLLYIHRFIRLTPTYAILIGIEATVVKYLGNGPYWSAMDQSAQNCKDNWWTNLLYINNLVKSDKMCNGESWYLANDMQFYLLSPLIIFPIWKWQVIGQSLLTCYTVLSLIAPALVVHFFDTNAAPIVSREMGDYYRQVYIRPYTRIQAYLVGIWLGLLLYRLRNRKVNVPPMLVALMWTIASAIALVVIFSIHSWYDPVSQIPKVSGLLYAGLSRFAWGCAMAWIIFACVKGYAGVINSFLSWSPFMPLGRLCFCVYLTSLRLQYIFHLRITQPIRYDTYTMVYFFFAHLVMSLMVGFVCTLVFESPFISLQKLLFEGEKATSSTVKSLEKGSHEKEPDQRNGIFYKDTNSIIHPPQVVNIK